MTFGKIRLLEKSSRKILLLFLFALIPLATFASSGNVPTIGPVRIEFILFGLVLLGVAIFDKHTFCHPDIQADL